MIWLGTALPLQRVRVTLVSVRGRSGSSPFCAARHAANSCAGMMYGIGEYNSRSFFFNRIVRVEMAANLFVRRVRDDDGLRLQTP